MDNCYFRNWNVLCWNVRGLNSEARQRDLRAKIEESRCSVICLQETKCESFDIRTIRSFCPRRFDQFAFSPSVGASGGILVVWNSSIFHGQLVDIQRFGVVVSFQSLQNSEKWTLTSVYGPCEGQPRDDFVSWLYHLQIPRMKIGSCWGTLISSDLWRTETFRVVIPMISFYSTK